MRFKKLFSKKGPIAKTLAILDIVVENIGDDTMFTYLLLLLGVLWMLSKVVFIVLNFRLQCKQLESKERLEMKKMELEAETRQLERKKRKK